MLVMQSSVFFLLLWLVDSLCIHLLGLVFPNMIVLGNWRFLPVEASIYAGFWLTFFVWTMNDYMSVRKVKLEPFSLKFLYFFIVDSLGVWIISRFSQYVGLGITSVWWALIIGVVAETFQLLSWRYFGKRLKD